MQEMKFLVGPKGSQHTEKIVGKKVFDWSGRDTTDEWWIKAETFVTDENKIAIFVMLWRQERFSKSKPESTAIYVDDFDGSNFDFLLSPVFGAKLRAFKESW